LPLLPIFKGKNILLITHGGDIMLRWDNWLRRLIKKKVLKRVDQYFPVSNATALYLEHFVPNSKLENIHTLYNGINREKFSGCRKKDEIRKSLNIPETTCLLLTVCNLIPRKGVDILLNADKLLEESDFNYLHVIVGRGSEEERLKNLAKENKISNSVKFIPYIESDQELAELFIASDLYVMMSRTEHNKMAMEGFGIVYAEAQYCGTPVIAGNTGGVPSAVRDDFTGYLISPSNPDAPEEIKDKIINLINDSEKYNRFSENARNFVSNSFDWDKYVTFLHNFLK
ncbi:MAG: glycosyltransferase family 4 protein, partial [Spirochaetales bacterium]|nr:glycosyltransferase family 4 protein [Spirochaetales bacterium]